MAIKPALLRTKDSKGVAVIFFVLTLAIMLGFLMMIINSGMLVYQKMRLQSAVDMASYAAASVQASYMGNEGNSERKISGSNEDSIKSLNMQIYKRYLKLLDELQFGWIAPAPGFAMPTVANIATCASLCAAASYANSKYAAKLYRAAAEDIEGMRAKIYTILEKLPEASRLAAEKTLELNIPELAMGDSQFGSKTTNKIADVLKYLKDGSGKSKAGTSGDAKNAILTFNTSKGMYLANVVGAVPHAYVFYGPACFDMNPVSAGMTPDYYCQVNGSGGDGPIGYGLAMAAFVRSKLPKSSGNIGSLEPIVGPKANGIRLQFVQNEFKPDPFTVVAAEWYPKSGSFMNLENSLGAKGSLFPKKTRLVAISAAEPFGGSLADFNSPPNGVRLQSIRRLLLDPRMLPVREDFGNLFDYMRMFGAVSNSGQPKEDPEAVIQKFLH
mgnify:CR=1 FL=1